MNAIISIKNSSIQIKDSAFEEISKFIQRFEMCFHSNHNLLMYSRSIFLSKKFKKMIDDSSSDEKEFESSEDNLSDINDTSSKFKKQIFL